MSTSDQVSIDVEAARALIEWKSLFADEVCEGAKRLAHQSRDPNSVTLPQYRQAALTALRTLSDAILAEEEPDGRQEAA